MIYYIIHNLLDNSSVYEKTWIKEKLSLNLLQKQH